MIHDKEFDEYRLKGLPGVLDNRSDKANEAYRERAAKIVEKYKKGEKDNITVNQLRRKPQMLHINMRKRSLKALEMLNI